jgi:hypothetical protein
MRIRPTVALLVVIAATGLWAQEKKLQDPAESKELNEQAYVRLLHTDLKTKKEAIIREEMQLTPQQAAAFWPIYRDYDTEQNKLIDQKLAVFQDYAQNFMSMNDEKADQLAQKVMTLDDQRMALTKEVLSAHEDRDSNRSSGSIFPRGKSTPISAGPSNRVDPADYRAGNGVDPEEPSHRPDLDFQTLRFK